MLASLLEQAQCLQVSSLADLTLEMCTPKLLARCGKIQAQKHAKGSHLSPVTINPVIRMSCLRPLFYPSDSEASLSNSEPSAYNRLFRSAERASEEAP